MVIPRRLSSMLVLVPLIGLSCLSKRKPALPLGVPPPIAVAPKIGPARTFSGEWGGPGSGPGQFDSPQSLAADGMGHVFVTDRGNARVQAFDSEGQFLRQWGTYGSGPGQFVAPSGIGTSHDGKVFVGDEDDGRIQVFSQAGVLLDSWTPNPATPLGGFYPTDIMVDEGGAIFVVDHWSAYVHKFNSNFQLVLIWGGFSDPYDGYTLYCPKQIVRVPGGNLLLSEEYPRRIMEFQSDGTYVSSPITGVPGMADVEFVGLARGPGGHLYVTDVYNNKIHVFDKDGDYLSSLGESGTGAGQFAYPWQLSVDLEGNLYVLDSALDKVVKFSP